MRAAKTNWNLDVLKLNQNKIEEMYSLYINKDKLHSTLRTYEFYDYYKIKEVDEDHIVVLFYVEKKHLDKFINKWFDNIRLLSDKNVRKNLCVKQKDFYKMLMGN